MSRGALEYLSASDWNLVASKSKKLAFDKEQILIREGSAAKTVFLIRSGKVRVERNNGGGRAVLVTLGPGAIFGEMAFIEDALTSASVMGARAASGLKRTARSRSRYRNGCARPLGCSRKQRTLRSSYHPTLVVCWFAWRTLLQNP